MKEFLSQYDIPMTVKNVVRDPLARAEFHSLGFLLPPVVVIDGDAVRGYDPERLSALLDEE